MGGKCNILEQPAKKKKKPSHTKTDKQIENLHLNLKLQ